MTKVLLLLAPIFAFGALAAMQSALTETDFHGRPGWTIENGRIRVTLLRGGGHIGEVRFLSADPKIAINPMYIPAGGGYVGHLVCFPHFGPASPEERQSGLAGHGEAGSVEWQQTRAPQVEGNNVTFFYGAELPKTNYRIERSVSLRSGEAIVRVEEWIENLVAYDRPYNRDQHATFGGPFVAPGTSILDMSATTGMTDPKRTGRDQWSTAREFTWPNAPRADGTTISLREFRAVPGGQVYTPVLADSSRPHAWFTLYNTALPLLVGYVFPTADHPWIIDWQNQPKPDTSAGTARGIEFGTSPWDEGLRRSVERARMFGTPTYKWIAARQRLSTTFTIFLAEIPSGFAGVQDVRGEGGAFVVSERVTGGQFTIQ